MLVHRGPIEGVDIGERPRVDIAIAVALPQLRLADPMLGEVHGGFFGIASGGTTPYVLGGLKYARKERGALTGLLTCTLIDERADIVDHVLYIATGPELITASTRMKAGTATKMVLNIISTTLMIQSGRIFENLMVDLRATNDKLRDRAARIVTTLTGLSRTDALALLDESGGNVKCAIVMQRRNVPRDEARRILEEGDGRLDRALNPEV